MIHMSVVLLFIVTIEWLTSALPFVIYITDLIPFDALISNPEIHTVSKMKYYACISSDSCR